MQDPIQYLSIADPDLCEKVKASLQQNAGEVSYENLKMLAEDAVWALSEELSFGYAAAMGYVELFKSPRQETIQKFHELITRYGQNGPTLGRLMAVYAVPVLKHESNDLLDLFLRTVEIMRTKGTYTLNSPLEAFSSLLNSADFESAHAFLELLCSTFSQEMSYNQSLNLTHTLPKAILSFSPSKRTWQIEQFQQIIRTDFRLADSFLSGMENGLNLLSKDALTRFVSVGLEKYLHNQDLASKFLSLESKVGINMCADMQVSAALTQVQYQLNRYLQARTGIPISVRPMSFLSSSLKEDNSCCDIVSDGKFIYLPEEISLFPNKEENTHLYKRLTRIEAGYYEFNTFDFDLEKAVEKIGKSEIQLTEYRKNLSDLEQFFMRFPSKHLASELFTIFEQGRIRKMMMQAYPGIVRQSFPMLQNEAIRIYQEQKIIQAIFFLYARIALDISFETFPCIRDEIISAVKHFSELFEKKFDKDHTVETCAELVFITYPDIEILIQKEIGYNDIETGYIPLKTPFGWKPRPALYYSTHRHSEQIAEALKLKLNEKNISIYKSDIKQFLMKNNNVISEDNIKELIVSSYQTAESADRHEAILNLSQLDLSEFLKKTSANEYENEDGSCSIFWYREWNSNLGDYLNHHVRVRDRFVNDLKLDHSTSAKTDFYRFTLQRYKGLVKQIRHAFELLKPEGLTLLRQWIEGDEFDYRALLDFALDKKAGITPSERLYIKRIKQQRDVAVLLLVDLSRSTANPVTPLSLSLQRRHSALVSHQGNEESVTVLDVEKEAIVLFCEALTIVGDSFAIAGFSGTGRLGVDYFRVKEFTEPMDDRIKGRINNMMPQRSTRMGAAIRHAACQLGKIPAKVRILIILSDGFPNDADYKQGYAIEDTRKSIAEARSQNIYIKAITVNLAGNSKLDELYGSVHHHVISDVRELPDKLLRIYGVMTR